ncbi:hypothetical protein pEaSNUABM20_00196 [Erwinia phage pEa_SNUABM_20]|nr:hypothetical protein pEaSNUABM20_00196 [Erwinia phage pEa_SNUABM_20]
MSLIKLKLNDAVKSQSAAPALAAFFKGLDKKALFAIIDDGMPSDLSGPNDILDMRFISVNGDTARFGIITKDEDEGFNVTGIDLRYEGEFDDEGDIQPSLAEAKKALARLR